MVYGRYERAFNSPLPTQFTNKTVDPRTKMKTYWESHIKSENMDNFELGIRGAIGNNITYSVAGFMSNTHNEILSVVKNGSSHMMREWRYINLEKTRRMGIELQSQQIFDKLKLKESFTYVNPKILSDDLERSTRQVYEDGLAVSIENNIKYRKRLMNEHLLAVDRKEEVAGVSYEDRKELAMQLNKMYDDVASKKLDAETTRKKAEELIETYGKIYKEKYKKERKKGREASRLFRNLDRIVTGKKSGDLVNLEANVEYLSEYYKNQLEAAIGGRFLGKGDQIPLTPKVKATFAADYQFTNKFNMGTNLTYIGSFTNAEPVNGYGIKTVKVPSHVVADLYGTYNVNEAFEVKFGVNNLFENKYYLRQDSKTATPAAGRTYNLGVTYRF